MKFTRRQFLQTGILAAAAGPSGGITLTGPNSATVKQGESTSLVYHLTKGKGQSLLTTYSISGLPLGLTASFSPTACKPNCQTTLRLVAQTAQVGNYSLIIQARNSKDVAFMSLYVAVIASQVADPLPAPTRWASQSGGGNGLSVGSPYQIADFWGDAAPDEVLGLLDGTYTGANSMIVPSVSGTSGHPIIIRAINDGAVHINGQNARIPIDISSRAFITVMGVNAYNSNSHVVNISNSQDVTVQRVCAWDADDDTNSHIWLVTGGSVDNILLEDVAAFGTGRYGFLYFASGTSSNLTIRRAWSRWMRNTIVGPKAGFNLAYSAYNALAENCIATWDETEMLGAGVNQPYGPMHAGDGSFSQAANVRILGSMSYVRGADEMAGGGFLPSPIFISNLPQKLTIEHYVVYIEPGTHTDVLPLELDSWAGGTDTERFLTRTTTIGGGTNYIEGEWTVTGMHDVDTVPTGANNIWDGSNTTGGRICKRYVDGTITETGLWPWPMDARINAAITQSGRNPDDFFGTDNTLTDLIESVFGTIPAACRS